MMGTNISDRYVTLHANAFYFTRRQVARAFLFSLFYSNSLSLSLYFNYSRASLALVVVSLFELFILHSCDISANLSE